MSRTIWAVSAVLVAIVVVSGGLLSWRASHIDKSSPAYGHGGTYAHALLGAGLGADRRSYKDLCAIKDGVDDPVTAREWRTGCLEVIDAYFANHITG